MIRWRLFKHKNQFIEIWDTLEKEWEDSHVSPLGEVQNVVEDSPENLGSIVRFRDGAFKRNHVTRRNSALCCSLPIDVEKELFKMIAGKP